MNAVVSDSTTMFKRALVVANPAAAGVSYAVVGAIAARLHGAVVEVDTLWTSQPGDAVNAARRAATDPDTDLIVAVGGDGTVREVAEGLARAPVRPGRSGTGGLVLLALPGGSGNSTCRNLWGELEWSDVLDAAFDPNRSVTRDLDLMRLVEPDADVLLGASSGFLAEVLIGAREVTGLAGRDRYYAAAAGGAGGHARPSHPGDRRR